mgnify:CR=1 FL=1
MNFFKYIIVLVFYILSSNLVSAREKPSIEVFVFDNKRNYQSVNLSITSQLNQNGFITKDGNLLLKTISNNKKLRYSYVIENIKLISNVSKADLFLFVKINYNQFNDYSSKISISSEIYNTRTNSFISSWSTPRKMITFPNNCDELCINYKVSETTILLSDQLGKSISGILNAQSYEAKNYENIAKTYNFKLLNFRQNDIVFLTDIMINQFPGFIKLSNEVNYGKQNSWTYYSSSHIQKLKKWIIIALNEINLSLDDDYEIIVSENNFFIKKFPVLNLRGSVGNPQKFN